MYFFCLIRFRLQPFSFLSIHSLNLPPKPHTLRLSKKQISSTSFWPDDGKRRPVRRVTVVSNLNKLRNSQRSAAYKYIHIYIYIYYVKAMKVHFPSVICFITGSPSKGFCNGHYKQKIVCQCAQSSTQRLCQCSQSSTQRSCQCPQSSTQRVGQRPRIFNTTSVPVPTNLQHNVCASAHLQHNVCASARENVKTSNQLHLFDPPTSSEPPPPRRRDLAPTKIKK